MLLFWAVVNKLVVNSLKPIKYEYVVSLSSVSLTFIDTLKVPGFTHTKLSLMVVNARAKNSSELSLYLTEELLS